MKQEKLKTQEDFLAEILQKSDKQFFTAEEMSILRSQILPLQILPLCWDYGWGVRDQIEKDYLKQQKDLEATGQTPHTPQEKMQTIYGMCAQVFNKFFETATGVFKVGMECRDLDGPLTFHAEGERFKENLLALMVPGYKKEEENGPTIPTEEAEKLIKETQQH